MDTRETLTPSDEPRESDKPQEIERAIDDTRRDLAGTVEEIEHRLSPAHVRAKAREATVGKVENMARNVRERTQSRGRAAIQTIKENPIPAIMAGVGVTWLFMNRSRGEERIGTFESGDGEVTRGEPSVGNGGRRGQEREIGGRGAEALELGREKMERAREGASETAERIRGKARDVAGQAQYQARRVEERFDKMMEDSPIAVGAIAMALGFAAGMAVPSTEREGELFGSARDRLLERAQSSTATAVEKAEEKLSQAAQQVNGDSPRPS